MHRQSPLSQAFVGYSGGGVRALVTEVADTLMMQEMKGSFMMGEAREKIESPQNYGFSSVVLPAKKGQDGKIEEAAEAYLSFLGGNRSFPVASVMEDRRHRPMGLKPGENAQYDDIGQMTLMRRGFLAMLSHDGEDGEGKKAERFVSLRHVEKQRQKRPTKKELEERATWSPEQLEVQAKADKEEREKHKHEGESVNTEVRANKSKVEFRTGDSVVGHYNTGGKEWQLTSGGDESKSVKVDSQHAHIKIGENSVWVDQFGCWSSKPIQLKPDPSSTEIIPDPLLARIEQLEARVRELEARLA